jgi:hypothetical protein
MPGPYYVDSTATGSASGADWANAFTTLAAGLAAATTNDVIYVAHDHAETDGSASLSLTTKTVRIICVDSAGSVPPVSADLRTSARIIRTGANSITIAGTNINTYWYGITFEAGTGATNANLVIGASGQRNYFKNCTFKKLGTTGSGTAIQIGGTGGHTVWDNCTLEFGAATDALSVTTELIWINTPASAVAGATLTTGLIAPSTSAIVHIEGVNLSALGGTSTVVRTVGQKCSVRLKDCQIGVTPTLASAPSVPYAVYDFIRVASADDNTAIARYTYGGTLTQETTCVRTGGASDGTTTYSWKVVPTASNNIVWAFECPPITFWNETVGSAITLTIEGYWSGGAVPTTADIWMDVECLGTASEMLGTFTSNGIADVLASGTNHTSSTESWGAGGTTKFKMSTTITAQEKGPVSVYIKYANVTETVYIDPKIVVS